MSRNKYPGNCFICSKRVEIGQGFFQNTYTLKKPHTTRWVVRCQDCVGKGNNDKPIMATNKTQRNTDICPVTNEEHAYWTNSHKDQVCLDCEQIG